MDSQHDGLMTHGLTHTSAMNAYEALVETLLSIGCALHGLEAILNGPVAIKVQQPKAALFETGGTE